MEKSFYRQTAEETIGELNSNREGLTVNEVTRRLGQYGPNKLVEKAKKGPVSMFFEQFKDFMILILLAAALIAGIIGELTDTLVIIAIVIANAVIGFIQEYRAGKAMDALKAMAAPQTVVIRENAVSKVPSSEIVPGDIVVLEAGAVVPADLRLIEVALLRIDEAALTGESVPVEKHAGAIDKVDLSLGDRLNMAYKGTIVTYGRGLGIVTATGMKTELGKIAAMLQDEAEVKTPLQKRLVVFGKKLAIVVLIICAVIFGMGILRGEKPLLMLLTAISLAVAAIPEALPAVITISLALGAKKMVKKNALVRKLPAVETLGSVTYICSDKTGTLTLNKMTVEEVYVDGQILRPGDPGIKKMNRLLQALALSNDAEKDCEGNLIGDPTETALYVAAEEQGVWKENLQTSMPRVAEVPFDSERKRMTTIHRSDDGHFISFTKGALDTILERADRVLSAEGVIPLDKAQIMKVNDNMAGKGLRVLCVAMKSWEAMPATITSDSVETDLTIIGLVGLMDPPRQEAKDAVMLCRTAGIRPVMITGDHPMTALAIAKRIGIVGEGENDTIVTGLEIEKMTDEALQEKARHVRVYARVAPEQKLRIVKALQKVGEFTAMTGDGVNDAPALKRADIGVAMGITGTDVSKEAAHMILLDDNFATIVNAVKEGRKIYDNIRKFIKYLLTTNSGEIWTLFLAQLVGLPVPLLPVHILWVNLITDGLPALALSVEPAEGNVMKRPPRHPKESIFAHGLGIHALWVGLFMALLVLSVQALSLYEHLGHWQTMVFTVLCLTQLGHSLAIRSERESLFVQGLFSNMALFGAVSFSLLLQLAVIYLPFAQKIFHTQPLTTMELIFCLVVSSFVFFAVETEKLFWRRKERRGTQR